MRLNSLLLQNIRSYTDHSIDFMNGISLFEGDIGSGKSSILNAIEFALFGLGNLSGTHLLRVGETSGRVELTIEVNNMEYTFGRSLKRRRSRVSQDECFIVEEGVKTHYNATDMKRRALQILNFREPLSPRSHSVIYRFAIFTPQDQMKEVISQRPDRRKETLRKAFGIEEYSVAVGNADVIRRDLQSEVRVLKASEKEIKGIQEKIEEEEKNREEVEKKISKAVEQLESLRKKIEENLEEIERKEKEEKAFLELSTKIELLNQEMNRLRDELDEIKGKIAENHQRLMDIENAERTRQGLEPVYIEYNTLKKRIQGLESKYEEFNEETHKIELIESSIKSERKGLEDRLGSTKRRIESLSSRINSLEKTIEEISPLTKKAEGLERATSPIDEIRKQHTDAQGSVQSTKQEIRQLSSTKKEKDEEWTNIEKLGIGAQCPRCQQELTAEHYKIVQAKYRNEIAELESKIDAANRLITEYKATAKKFHKEILELEEKLASLQQIKVKLGGLNTQRETLQNLKGEHGEAVSEVSELEALLDNDSFASERIAQIKDIELKLSDLRPHAESYRSMKEKIEQYETDKVERRYLEAKGEADRKPEFETQKTNLEENKKKVQSNFSETEKELKKKSKEHEEKKRIITELKELRNERTSLLQSQTEQKTVISVAKPQLEGIQERVESLKRDLKRHETNLVQADILGIVRSWLEMAFIPSLQAIEKAVLLSLNQEFNRLFQRWFRDLIEVGELNGYIDEDFTPIVEQGGYELEVESLSGGEKTSVALAYRLALNTIVKQVTDTMKSNILILDEPTDGFSREQLHKMREILNDVNCDQIIMVSHEVELDNVADHIYRVRKEGNISTVIAPS